MKNSKAYRNWIFASLVGCELVSGFGGLVAVVNGYFSLGISLVGIGLVYSGVMLRSTNKEREVKVYEQQGEN